MTSQRPRINRTHINSLEAMGDEHLFAPWFTDPTSWEAWFTFVAVLFALPLTSEQLAIYQQCTGRQTPPTIPHKEAWLVCGRRSGKSFMLALIATFLACFHDFSRFLAPGERATVMIVCADKKQARVVLRYISGLLRGVPMLSRLIERETAEALDRKNRITIEVATASWKTVRGYTICAALLDELAFFSTDDDAANPDSAVIAAIRPATLTIPNAMLLCSSSPYARKGALWDAHRKHFGRDNDPVLVWQAATRTMNPTVSQAVIDEELERDPASARAEYLAEFRSDVQGFVAAEPVRACTATGIYERPYQQGVTFHAFCDPSGGSQDSMTLCIAHSAASTGTVIIDCIREQKAPFSPEQTVQQFSDVLKSYRVSKLIGDRFGGAWPVEAFSKVGILYEPSAKPKSDLYVDLLPLVNSARVELLDHPRCIAQLLALERRVARSGRDSIDHPPGGHDDVINAVAGAASIAVSTYGSYDTSYSGFAPDATDATDNQQTSREWRIQQLASFLNSQISPW